MCNTMAQLTHYVMETADADFTDEEVEGDIYSPNFRRGYKDEEDIVVVAPEVTEVKVMTEEAKTDWSVEAVVDEDQL
jgi:hypothetical protein